MSTIDRGLNLLYHSSEVYTHITHPPTEPPTYLLQQVAYLITDAGFLLFNLVQKFWTQSWFAENMVAILGSSIIFCGARK